MRQTRSLFRRACALLGFVCCGLSSAPGWAADPKNPTTQLDQKEFFKPELYISTAHVELQDVLPQLPNREAWEGFMARNLDAAGEPKFVVYLDHRSGAATNLMGPVPMIPGSGVGNRVTLASLGQRIGREVTAVDSSVVRDAVLSFVKANRAIIGIDPAQLGEARVTQVNPDLWQVSIPQVVAGIPVRDARLAASISHGNMVVMGAETWANVKIDTAPLIKAEKAVELGYAYINGPAAHDVMVRAPQLEIVPYAPQEFQAGEAFAGVIGKGYGHRLVWTYVIERGPELARWETMVDARTGEVLAFQDTNHYADRQVSGGVYPVTSTGVCTIAARCGVMQTGWPMPFANTQTTGSFADSAGIFDWVSGNTTTTLSGDFVRISDACGAISLTSTTGNLALGGTNNQHDCTTAGVGGAGNTAASRTAFYEVNKLQEMARGWLPTNNWLLNTQLVANVNINSTCNAFWNGSSINFYRSGGGCRNTGELAGVFDHEWGHGMDDFDANGSLSNSSEAYADIAAIYRYQDSCVGHGFFATSNRGCGQTLDGTGFNSNEAQVGAAHCDTDCSGVRDADWAKHSPAGADTALGFVCGSCTTGSGPCGRQVHCAAAPVRQAAWDLVARDLPNPLSQSAFVIANRLFYQGSGNVGAWHSCTCGGTSSGCGATNGYMQWLTADDDNGNVNDGTPHRTAIFNAFNRHGIACATPTAQSGCAGAPGAPTLTATPSSSQVSLSWNAVAGASRYWVFRTEGVEVNNTGGCNNGKALISNQTGTTFTDLRVANGRRYFYNVVAQGSSASCFSPVSNCTPVTPGGAPNPDFAVACSPSSLTVAQGGSVTSNCTVSSINGFNGAVTLACGPMPTGVTCSFSANPVTPPANGNASSTLTINAAGNAQTGTSARQVNGTNGGNTRSANINLTVNQVGGGDVFFDDFEINRGWTPNPNATDTATTGRFERADPQQSPATGTAMQLGTTPSGVFALVTEGDAGATVGVNDVDGGTTSIRSPAITLPATGTLTLSFSYYLAHLTNATNVDFFRVSIVSGGNTTLVFQSLGVASTTRAASYTNQSVNISQFAGQTVNVLIQAADAGTGSLIEAAVDNVRITQQ
jgi:trimeric autotransporter adhesin